MINWLTQTLGLALREAWAFEQIFKVLGQIGKRGFAATLAILTELFSFLLYGTPITPYGDELDLTGYSIVFEEEFEGDTVNWDIWTPRHTGPNGLGFLSTNQTTVKDGNLYLTGEYLEDGEYGEGWYAGELVLKEKYTYGYFEINCICNNSEGFWSAFWLRSDDPYNSAVSLGGPGGAEVDILESLKFEEGYSANKLSIHVAGIDGPEDEGIDSYHMPCFNTKNNMYTEYNTYGVMWTPDEYIYYINGVECIRTDYGTGTCEVPMEVLISLCIPGTPSSYLYDDFENLSKDEAYNFIVDYVRIYQLTPTAE